MTPAQVWYKEWGMEHPGFYDEAVVVFLLRHYLFPRFPDMEFLDVFKNILAWKETAN